MKAVTLFLILMLVLPVAPAFGCDMAMDQDLETAPTQMAEHDCCDTDVSRTELPADEDSCEWSAHCGACVTASPAAVQLASVFLVHAVMVPPATPIPGLAAEHRRQLLRPPIS